MLSPKPNPNLYHAPLVRTPKMHPAPALRSSSVRSVYRPDASSFPGPTSFDRAHWQSSCAILSSKSLSSQHQPHNHKEGNSNGSGSTDSDSPLPSNDPGNHFSTPAGINGSNSSTTSLDLVPMSNLPRPLSIADLSPAPMHGAQLRVAYQGVPGAYSEAAAGKAYPNCEAIPCDQFEVAFQAVELWIADRAVLPVENSLGGSIHRNYDLLLRHRLHIVGEVQMPVHHCLLALPGVRKEYLTRVISHPQALAQCELTLNSMGLNVARESFDDTAAAAEYIATNGLRDTAAIASARAAELYGLQVCLIVFSVVVSI